MSTPTREYYEAKAELCRKVALDQLVALDVKNAIMNIQRAQIASARAIQLEEEGK